VKITNELLDICFEGINVYKTLHCCCGYPDKLEDTEYLKADPSSYIKMAPVLDNSCIDAVSLEDAH
jgi:5-methyltetrahydropteroyltriglutamate--homocysteine methyltransferase